MAVRSRAAPARREPRRQLRFPARRPGEGLPRGKMAAPRSLLPRSPSWSPDGAQGRRGADAEIREPLRGPRPLPAPREVTSPGRAPRAGAGPPERQGRGPPRAEGGPRAGAGAPRPPGHCSPAAAPNPSPPLPAARGQEVVSSRPRPLPSAPEVIGGGCGRAARRRVDLLRAERPESSSTSSCRRALPPPVGLHLPPLLAQSLPDD